MKFYVVAIYNKTTNELIQKEVEAESIEDAKRVAFKIYSNSFLLGFNDLVINVIHI